MIFLDKFSLDKMVNNFRILKRNWIELKSSAMLDCRVRVGLQEAFDVVALGNAELFTHHMDYAVLRATNEH